MTESEFNQLSDSVFTRIEQAADAAGIDATLNGNVLELELDDGQKIIVNRHTPNQEIWIAARTGGFHYAWDGTRWSSQRDGSELFGKLTEVTASTDGDALAF
ncbi:iron donor protein CyaY [Ferriphaselus sp. R-1]|uniref:iron donor protein CyaY n=1 Tax=Ferriphaselus sp. R-1 TaxID=1485544 RepID=UPI00055867F8|nr:iron donor protein CyaY [Ferriphaselus sp. R-1]